MPHRDPLHATLARIVQVRARIAELDVHPGGCVVEPTSLAEAMAERERLEQLLVVLEPGAIAAPEPSEVASAEPETDVAAMVMQEMQNWPPRERLTWREDWRNASLGKRVFLAMGPFLILAVLFAWPE